MSIIKSIFDNDLYKFTMMRAVLEHCSGVPVEYTFHDRRKTGKFTDEFHAALRTEIEAMRYVNHPNVNHLFEKEHSFLKNECKFLGSQFLGYLRGYQFDPRQVATEVSNGELKLSIAGAWEQVILWEVPLMSIISELYFKLCDKDWVNYEEVQSHKNMDNVRNLVGIPFADYGTRRRRSYEAQSQNVYWFKDRSPSFVGTSNVHLAAKYNVRPLGTMAHEWIMGISALEGLRHANRYALKIWSDVYKGDLGTALTDTFGSNAFFADFDGYLARLFDGVRHDSGDPIEFMHKVVAHYERLRIDPMTKTIIFSDGLTSEEAARIFRSCKDLIRCAFGIGTSFTNDFQRLDGTKSPPLNMVIKMSKCNGIPVVKLSDTPTKAVGDKDALRVAKWTFNNTPLDQ